MSEGELGRCVGASAAASDRSSAVGSCGAVANVPGRGRGEGDEEDCGADVTGTEVDASTGVLAGRNEGSVLETPRGIGAVVWLGEGGVGVMGVGGSTPSVGVRVAVVMWSGKCRNGGAAPSRSATAREADVDASGTSTVGWSCAREV